MDGTTSNVASKYRSVVNSRLCSCSDDANINASLRLTVSNKLSTPPSGSFKCLRFGLRPTLRTLNYIFIYLLTYLLKNAVLFSQAVCHATVENVSVTIHHTFAFSFMA